MDIKDKVLIDKSEYDELLHLSQLYRIQDSKGKGVGTTFMVTENGYFTKYTTKIHYCKVKEDVFNELVEEHKKELLNIHRKNRNLRKKLSDLRKSQKESKILKFLRTIFFEDNRYIRVRRKDLEEIQKNNTEIDKTI